MLCTASEFLLNNTHLSNIWPLEQMNFTSTGGFDILPAYIWNYCE